MSAAAVSPRDLVLRNGTSAEKSATPVDLEPKPDIGDGNQRLHSFYRPGLAAGTYNIDVEQRIAAYNPPEKKKFADIPAADKLDPKTSTKSFTVIAPQYALPAGSINTTYPAPGHQAPHTTLPHVVLNDPQLPWERVGSESELLPGHEHHDDLAKTRTPWLAVLLFSQDEIMLPAETQSSLESVLDLPKSPTKFAPSPTFTYNLNIANFINKLHNSKDFSTPLVTFDADVNDPASTQGDIVCVKAEALQELMRSFGANGEPSTSQTNPDVSRYRWLAHVRQVDTTGMAQAGSTTGLLGERDSLFSVVLSHRTGPLGTTQPTSVVAHLVSIEGMEAMSFPFTTPYVALTSLHSWTYMSLPPDSLSLHDAFSNLGKFHNTETGVQNQVLRAPVTKKELDMLRSQGDAGNAVANRLENGYSLSRYRLQTGEQTVSFYRGPLVPTSVKYPLQEGWDAPSTHGTNRQIFDRRVGIMDLSYSSAWQLGRTLALADRSFTIALARVRRQIQAVGAEKGKKQEMEKKTLFRNKVSTIRSLANSMSLLEKLPASDALLTSDVANRWQAKSIPEVVDVSFRAMGEDQGEAKRAELQRHLNEAAEEISGSLQDSKVPYDEFNTPRSTDWMTVLKWVLDRMYLADVPAHYLISDPSHLPLETIRFFEVDRNWTDSLIDGALSLANHLERNDDMVRRAMQHALKRYLQTESPRLHGLPPVPRYGFLLRSELVTAFPDMVVKTEPTPSPSNPVLIRHVLLDSNVMLCLFDRPPTKGSFESVTLSQPAHQPCFSAASTLTSQAVEVSLKSIYSGPAHDQPHGDSRLHNLKDGDLTLNRGDTPTETSPVLFIWDVKDQPKPPSGTYGSVPALRFLNTNSFATWAHGKVVAGMEGKYTEPKPTSSLVAYQLNDPSWQLTVQLDLSRQQVEAESANQPPPAPPAQPSLQATTLASMAEVASPTPTKNNIPKTTLKSLGRGFQRAKPLVLSPRPPNMSTIPTRIESPKATAELASSLQIMSISDDANSSGSGPALAPSFKFRLFSIDSDPGADDDTLIPSPPPKQAETSVPVAQDLIFSVTLASDKSALSNFHLQKITISIPFDHSPEVLMADYSGPGGFMITNLRFNVVCSLVREDAHRSSRRSLRVELLPRTHLGAVFVGKCEDLTFLLAGIVVAPVKTEEKFELAVKVKYKERQGIDAVVPVKRAKKVVPKPTA